MTIVTLSLSAVTFLFATIFLGVVARHNAGFSWIHSQGLDPNSSFYGTWVLIMIAVVFTFIFAISSFAIHLAKFFQRLPFSLLNIRLAIMDITIAVLSFIGWLTFAIYFYGVLGNQLGMNVNNIFQYEENVINSGNFAVPPSNPAINGSEVAFGVLTMIVATMTAIITFQVPEVVLLPTQNPALGASPVMTPTTEDTKAYNIEIEP